jgi:hypothetical protein
MRCVTILLSSVSIPHTPIGDFLAYSVHIGSPSNFYWSSVAGPRRYRWQNRVKEGMADVQRFLATQDLPGRDGRDL